MNRLEEKMTPDGFLEREAGGRHHRAVVLLELQSAVEGAYEDFRYDDAAPRDVVAALKLLKDYDFRV